MPITSENADILTELFNISVGRAASLLSEITHKRIQLHVPRLEMVDLTAAGENLQKYLPQVARGTMMVSSIRFRDRLSGQARLLFPTEKMRRFITMCTEETGAVAGGVNFTDIDFDIIKEIGNIILNSIIGELANFLKVKLEYTLSEVKIYNRDELRDNLSSDGCRHILVLYITFKIQDAEIEGAVIISLTMDSVLHLLQNAKKIEEDFCG